MKHVLAVAFIALFLAGCGPAANTPDIGDPFVGGTKGLVLSFEKGGPPTEIFDAGQYPFSVIVRAENLGEADVGPRAVEGPTGENTFALIELVGVNPLQFNSPRMSKLFEEEDVTLYGAKRNFDGTIVAGTADVVTFEGFKYLPDEHGNSQVTMRANVCYDYSTRSNTRVCIKDNVLENIQDSSICVLSGVKAVKNSGAPVQVTTVSQNPLGRDKIQVTFTVENVGAGQIYRSVSNAPGGQGYTGGISQAGPCDSRLTNMNRDYLYVKIFVGDDITTSTIDCPLLDGGNEGYINLFQGSAATLSCTLLTDPSNNRVYTDTMHINLYYAYSEFVETPILIRDVSVGSPR